MFRRRIAVAGLALTVVLVCTLLALSAATPVPTGGCDIEVGGPTSHISMKLENQTGKKVSDVLITIVATPPATPPNITSVTSNKGFKVDDNNNGKLDEAEKEKGTERTKDASTSWRLILDTKLANKGVIDLKIALSANTPPEGTRIKILFSEVDGDGQHWDLVAAPTTTGDATLVLGGGAYASLLDSVALLRESLTSWPGLALHPEDDLIVLQGASAGCRLSSGCCCIGEPVMALGCGHAVASVSGVAESLGPEGPIWEDVTGQLHITSRWLGFGLHVHSSVSDSPIVPYGEFLAGVDQLTLVFQEAQPELEEITEQDMMDLPSIICRFNVEARLGVAFEIGDRWDLSVSAGVRFAGRCGTQPLHVEPMAAVSLGCGF